MNIITEGSYSLSEISLYKQKNQYWVFTAIKQKVGIHMSTKKVWIVYK